MKHGRPDYDERIQDSMGLIPEDEPVFLIRDQDMLGPRIVIMYAMLLELVASAYIFSQGYVTDRASQLNFMAEAARRQAQAMSDWQQAQGTSRGTAKGKTPDRPY